MERSAQADIRPQYAMENREDLMYHDNEVRTEPEFCAFTKRTWVFNRAMRWIEDGPDGCLLCCCDGGDLYLTGGDQASQWHSDPANSIEEDGDFTRFVKLSTTRRADCAVLPAFQFHLGQHPKLELEVADATSDWQFNVFIKGRSGPPLLSSGWRRGACSLSFDIAGELKKRGYDLQFAELHFAMGAWSESKEAAVSARFRLKFPGHPAIVTCLPVIRTAAGASRDGVPVAAAVLDGLGERLRKDRLSVHALVEGQTTPLVEERGVWTARLQGLKPGEYEVELVSEGAVNQRAAVHVRITDGKFFSYDKRYRALARDGQPASPPAGPLSGSYQGMVFFKDVGLPGERMIQGQGDWDSWDRTQEPGEHWHYWEALTESELDERFRYLAGCGWTLLHVCQHWGTWERLDAGGRIAPHGAEQLALYLRVASRHGLAVLQALSHYPYAAPEEIESLRTGTPPFSRYLDSGFRTGDWTDPDNNAAFTGMFHDYLRHFISLFRDETALFAMTTSGEGDIKAGPHRVNRTNDFVLSLDKNHLFMAEPIFRLNKLPEDHCEGWKPELVGSRTYWIGAEIFPEFDLGVEFKFMQFGHVVMAEGCWPCPPRYSKLHELPESWCGTPSYRIRLRDSLYLGLIHRIPAILTWDEQVAEDERIVFDRVRRLVDWSQSFMEPKVFLRVDGTSLVGEGRKTLAEYEKAFASLPLAYSLLLPDVPLPDPSPAVIDARAAYERPCFMSEGGVLPDSLKESMPVGVSSGYAASYLWSQDRYTLLAYIYNTTNHVEAHPRTAQGLAGKFHRAPQPARLEMSLQGFPAQGCTYAVYDLTAKTVFREGSLPGVLEINIGSTDSDYLVLVQPNRMT